MRKRKTLFGVLLIAVALVIMTLPVSEADAATAASDFVMEGSTLVRYRGTEKNVSVPDTVEVIGKSAFEDNTNIELVVIPNSVVRIEPYAFWGCDDLDTVVLGRGLTDVGDYAFAGCKGLQQMSIPSNVTSIGVQAFADCVNMTDITIPAETRYIHESAFDGCARLTIHCDEGTVADTYAQDFYERQKEMPEYEDVPNYQPDDVNQGNTPTPEPESTPTPAPTPTSTEGETIGSTSVVGNQAVVFLPSKEMEVLEPTPAPIPTPEVSVPSALTDLAELMGNMITVGPVSGIPKYTVVDGRIVADQAFYRSDSLEEVSLKQGITEIGQFAFARSTLKKIEIPAGVTNIGYGAFYHCDGLESVSLPDSVMNVEPKAFDFTAMLDNFKNDGTAFLVNGGVLLAYNGSDSQVFVPGGIRVIAAEVFAGHEEIESVRLPDSVLVVGEAAFENCTGLRQVNLGAGVEQIKDRAFAGCTSLEAIKLPASVQETGALAFGDAQVIYNGDRPTETYELSATRLSNEQYRDVMPENGQPGVTVTGAAPSAARLEGAARSYILNVEQKTELSEMEAAWKRAMNSEMPENMAVYELQLADNSGIPLTKLGRSGLNVALPLPETLSGQELKLVTLDRNGQLEAVGVERVMLEGVECFRFRTTHLSLFGVYGVGPGEKEIREVNVSLSSMSAGLGSPAAGENGKNSMLILKFVLGAAILVTGMVLCLPEVLRRKRRG
ncbi:MAG: leucine-rich repeat domain-containing protein [Firmicutes bacterium]|nr:leucine-rich repeat domain-containing protein [Bacillota bacterium]